MKKGQWFTLAIMIALAIGTLLVKKNSSNIVKDTIFDPPIAKTKTEKNTFSTNLKPSTPEKSPAMPAHRATPEDKVDFKKLTIKEFRDFAQEALLIMPKKKDIQKLPKEKVHHIPEPVIQAGRRLGKIREMLTDRPDLIIEAEIFYAKCASDNFNMSSVRALCLTHYIHLKKDKDEDVDLSKYPSNVVELSKLVLDL